MKTAEMRMVKRYFALLLTLCFAFQVTAFGANTQNVTKKVGNDTYSLMYDSAQQASNKSDSNNVDNNGNQESRFIIKYRSQTGGDVPGLLSKDKGSAKALKHERSGKFEKLVLNEKVNPKDLAKRLKDDGADQYIEYIQPDFKMQSFGGSEGASQVRLQRREAETLNTGKAEVTVAVIDTGIDITHPAFSYNNTYQIQQDTIWKNVSEVAGDGIDNDGNGYVDDVSGWNFYDDNATVYDSSSPSQSTHGTHVAGIIKTVIESYNVKIMPLKVFGENGAYTSDIIDAIHYAEANGAKIVNCSFGSSEDNLALKEAIEESSMLFVCAVGNLHSDLAAAPVYPACFGLDNIISVASTNASGALSSFSNYSSSIADVAARGENINSTLPGGSYGYENGTSQAAAYVSGVAAAVLSAQNNLAAAELRQRLIKTAGKLSNLQDTVIDGRQINLSNAVQNLEQTAVVQNNPTSDSGDSGSTQAGSGDYSLFSYGNVTLHNLITNGGFENGTSDWNAGANSIVTTFSRFGSHSLKNINSTAYGCYWRNSGIHVIAGHKYYFRSSLKVVNVVSGTVFNVLGMFDSIGQWLSSIQTGYTTVPCDWRDSSGILIAPANSNYCQIFVADHDQNSTCEIYSDGVMLFDL
ncbi:MAG: S8 family serine peptidase, partial [Clostridiales bacterium]|nr:S8 family serine peptidase [Clostridiales bacterium]